MFFEIGIDSETFTRAGFLGRDELEDPLEERLRDRGLGEVTGGGGGSGRMNIDVEMAPHLEAETGATILLALLKEVGAPKNTTITSGSPERETWSLGSSVTTTRPGKRSHSAGSVSLEVAKTRSRVSLDLWVKYRRLILRDASIEAAHKLPIPREEITANQHCVSVPVNAVESVRLVLWRGGQPLSRRPQFDGPITLRTGALVLASIVLEEFFCMSLGREPVRARVWTNDQIEPEKVWVQISDD